LHIPFKRPLAVGDEIDYIRAAFARPKFCFTASCVLRAQLEHRDQIQSARPRLWGKLPARIKRLGYRQWRATSNDSTECEQSYHMFYLILPSLDRRQGLIWHLSQREIFAVFHHLPLHLSPMGLRFGGRQGDYPVTEDLADRLLRFPFFTGMSSSEQSQVIKAVRGFRC
jgi:dTDP-4-amino-4,6-dideoxygalactose transaminase